MKPRSFSSLPRPLCRWCCCSPAGSCSPPGWRAGASWSPTPAPPNASSPPTTPPSPSSYVFDGQDSRAPDHKDIVHLIAKTRKHLTALQVKRGSSQQVGRAVCGRAHLHVEYDLLKLELVSLTWTRQMVTRLSEAQPGQHRAVDGECPSCLCRTLPSPAPSCSACPLSGLLKSGMDGRSSSPHLTFKFSLKHQTPLLSGSVVRYVVDVSAHYGALDTTVGSCGGGGGCSLLLPLQEEEERMAPSDEISSSFFSFPSSSSFSSSCRVAPPDEEGGWCLRGCAHPLKLPLLLAVQGQSKDCRDRHAKSA